MGWFRRNRDQEAAHEELSRLFTTDEVEAQRWFEENAHRLSNSVKGEWSGRLRDAKANRSSQLGQLRQEVRADPEAAGHYHGVVQSLRDEGKFTDAELAPIQYEIDLMLHPERVAQQLFARARRETDDGQRVGILEQLLRDVPQTPLRGEASAMYVGTVVEIAYETILNGASFAEATALLFDVNDNLESLVEESASIDPYVPVDKVIEELEEYGAEEREPVYVKADDKNVVAGATIRIARLEKQNFSSGYFAERNQAVSIGTRANVLDTNGELVRAQIPGRKINWDTDWTFDEFKKEGTKAKNLVVLTRREIEIELQPEKGSAFDQHQYLGQVKRLASLLEHHRADNGSQKQLPGDAYTDKQAAIEDAT